MASPRARPGAYGRSTLIIVITIVISIIVINELMMLIHIINRTLNMIMIISMKLIR